MTQERFVTVLQSKNWQGWWLRRRRTCGRGRGAVFENRDKFLLLTGETLPTRCCWHRVTKGRIRTCSWTKQNLKTGDKNNPNFPDGETGQMWGVGETHQLVSFLIHFRLPENQDQTNMLPNQTFWLSRSDVILWMVLFSGVILFSPKPHVRGKFEYYGTIQNSIFSKLNAIAVLQVYVLSRHKIKRVMPCGHQEILQYCSILK